MKLNRLESTTQRPTPDSVERARPVTDEKIRRVEAMEGVEADRQRSLQQEIDTFDPRVIAPFGGRAQVLEDARRVAAQLSLHGSNLDGLVKLQALSLPVLRIDDTV